MFRNRVAMHLENSSQQRKDDGIDLPPASMQENYKFIIVKFGTIVIFLWNEKCSLKIIEIEIAFSKHPSTAMVHTGKWMKIRHQHNIRQHNIQQIESVD